jgi:hypothetical protein
MNTIPSWALPLPFAANHYPVALAVLKFCNKAPRLPWWLVGLAHDFHATGPQSFHGRINVLGDEYEDGSLGRRTVLPRYEVQRCFRVRECEFNPVPTVLTHRLVGGDSAVEMLGVELFRTHLIGHWKLGKLDVHSHLREYGLGLK